MLGPSCGSVRFGRWRCAGRGLGIEGKGAPAPALEVACDAYRRIRRVASHSTRFRVCPLSPTLGRVGSVVQSGVSGVRGVVRALRERVRGSRRTNVLVGNTFVRCAKFWAGFATVCVEIRPTTSAGGSPSPSVTAAHASATQANRAARHQSDAKPAKQKRAQRDGTTCSGSTPSATPGTVPGVASALQVDLAGVERGAPAARQLDERRPSPSMPVAVPAPPDQ